MALLKHLDIIGSILVLCAISFYIISTLRGETKPSRSTWWILALVSFLTLATSYSLGIKENLWVQIAYLLGYILIASLSLSPKYGYGSKLYPLDIVCIIGAIVCAVVWIVFNSAFVAFLGAIVVDLIGLVPTIIKVWSDSSSENTKAWLIGTAGALVNASGISVWFSTTHIDWIYALYLLVTNFLITILVIKNKRQIKTNTDFSVIIK